jgi:hypothetical protein
MCPAAAEYPDGGMFGEEMQTPVVPRSPEPPVATAVGAQKDLAAAYFGQDGATRRLGRASMLRGLSSAQYSQLKRRRNELARGPYLPLIIEACKEEEFSYEYRHGATSHGAFTFSLANILRRERRAITFESLVDKTRKQLVDLQYDQTPQILGPTAIRHHKIPWIARR